MAERKPRVKTPEQLREYRRKRDFSRTTEPPGEPAAARARPDDASAFVVHRHEASHLHYDLRLEWNGVLVSWAVPKGFSWVPADKHLAVRTEDHPLEYLEFDGVIPKGEYGAGTMTIWDRGTYRETRGSLGEALAEGEVKLALDGGRLRGEWHLVKTRGEKDWLLFKTRDVYARSAGDAPFPLVLPPDGRSAFPRTCRAMTATPDSEALAEGDWAYELDFAGRRILARLHGGEVRFVGADGRRFPGDLPEIATDLSAVRCRSAIVDGVLVAVDAADRPDPELLRRRLASGETGDLVFYAFDLLRYDDWSLAAFPLLERKEALRAILPPSSRVLYVDHVRERGDELLQVVAQGGLPGVIAKRVDSRYRPGASTAWKRIAAPRGRNADAGSVHERLGTPRRRTRTKLSNLGKVYWPESGITKGQLVDYYDAIAPHLLPYLKDRPCHLLRYPDGIEGKSFYQKNVTGRIPAWVPTQLVKVEGGEEVRYVVCNDRDTLLHLVNLGSIDLHPWLSRCDDPERPDVAVIDLDPSTADFAKVVRIAQTVGRILRGAGLRPALKTSGATGLHIYLPLVREYTYEQARMFCEAVARMTVQEHRNIATVERSVSRREDKVYVDFGQNRREQTLVPPYVVRPVPGAQVSTPLDWDELRSDLHPSNFDLFNVPARVEQLGDLFAGVLNEPQRLEDAIAALAQRPYDPRDSREGGVP